MIYLPQFRCRGLGLVAIAIGFCVCPSFAQAGLLDYVKAPESHYSWKVKAKTTSEQGTIYDLSLVSQVWHDIKWEHQLQVYQPKGVDPNATMLVYNTGGNASAGNIAFGMTLAKMVKAPVAFLYNIPNQPLLGDKKEDTLIAETFVRYLETKDDTWPLLFAMVKSVVKAMDALQAFANEVWKQPIKGFIISGASKRGWTSWLTGAADPRVVAIAPLVIDTLNMAKQMNYQKESFGDYSEQVEDYTKRNLVPMPKTEEARKLWQMVDPLFYTDRLTMPKFLINGNNDPYWTADALNLYWGELKGPKYVCYVPNAGHDLKQTTKDKKEDRSRAINALAAFARTIITGKSLPKLEWKHETVDGQFRLTVDSSAPPKSARLWFAEAPTRDFRLFPWKEQPVQVDANKVTGFVKAPKTGCLAFYEDLEYEVDGIPYHLCTQIRIVGKPK